MNTNKKTPKLRFKGFADDWEQHKLSDILVERNEQHVETSEYPLMSFVQGIGVTPKGERYDRSFLVLDQSKKYKRTELGDFIYSSNNLETGSIGINKTGKAVISPVYSIFYGVSIGDSEFIGIMSLLPGFIAKMIRFRQGVVYGQWRIHEKDFLNISVSIPSVDERTKITKLILSIEELITLHQRKLEKLKLNKSALLQKLFPQYGCTIPEVRFKEFTGAWEQRKLSELATMNARIGWQNLRTSEFLDSGDYLLITGTDFDNGRVKYSTCHYVEKKRFDQDTKIQLSTGSILITKDGTLGKVALVEELPKPATLNAGVFNVRVKDDAVLSYKYLYHYLKAPFLMKYVTANATGGTIKHLNQSILVNFPIPITEKPEQDRIAKLLDSLESSITLHQRKLDRLISIKKALLQQIFV